MTTRIKATTQAEAGVTATTIRTSVVTTPGDIAVTTTTTMRTNIPIQVITTTTGKT